MSEWIRPEDRLPMAGETVIITDCVHDWQVGCFRRIVDGDPQRWKWKWEKEADVRYWMPKEGALPPVPVE